MGCVKSVKARIAPDGTVEEPVDWEEFPGKIHKMYHGTSLTAAREIEINGFTPSKNGELGPGIYFVDEHNIDKAKRFAHDYFRRTRGKGSATADNEPALLECEVKIERHHKADAPDRAGEWRKRGFDACSTDKTAASSSSEWCVSNPRRIRVVAVRDLRGTPCPWGKFCPYTTKTKVANSPWGGVCPCQSLKPAPPPPPPVCLQAGCGKPTWNGRPNEFCSKQCRAKALAPAPPDASNWEVAWSTKHEKWYYQDRIAGESSWTQPPGCTLELPSNPPDGFRGENGSALPAGWESEWDVTHKRLYYFNRQTKERRWTRPKSSS